MKSRKPAKAPLYKLDETVLNRILSSADDKIASARPSTKRTLPAISSRKNATTKPKSAEQTHNPRGRLVPHDSLPLSQIPVPRPRAISWGSDPDRLHARIAERVGSTFQADIDDAVRSFLVANNTKPLARPPWTYEEAGRVIAPIPVIAIMQPDMIVSMIMIREALVNLECAWEDKMVIESVNRRFMAKNDLTDVLIARKLYQQERERIESLYKTEFKRTSSSRPTSDDLSDVSADSEDETDPEIPPPPEQQPMAMPPLPESLPDNFLMTTPIILFFTRFDMTTVGVQTDIAVRWVGEILDRCVDSPMSVGDILPDRFARRLRLEMGQILGEALISRADRLIDALSAPRLLLTIRVRVTPHARLEGALRGTEVGERLLHMVKILNEVVTSANPAQPTVLRELDTLVASSRMATFITGTDAPIALGPLLDTLSVEMHPMHEDIMDSLHHSWDTMVDSFQNIAGPGGVVKLPPGIEQRVASRLEKLEVIVGEALVRVQEECVTKIRPAAAAVSQFYRVGLSEAFKRAFPRYSGPHIVNIVNERHVRRAIMLSTGGSWPTKPLKSDAVDLNVVSQTMSDITRMTADIESIQGLMKFPPFALSLHPLKYTAISILHHAKMDLLSETHQRVSLRVARSLKAQVNFERKLNRIPRSPDDIVKLRDALEAAGPTIDQLHESIESDLRPVLNLLHENRYYTRDAVTQSFYKLIGASERIGRLQRLTNLRLESAGHQFSVHFMEKARSIKESFTEMGPSIQRALVLEGGSADENYTLVSRTREEMDTLFDECAVLNRHERIIGMTPTDFSLIRSTVELIKNVCHVWHVSAHWTVTKSALMYGELLVQNPDEAKNLINEESVTLRRLKVDLSDYGSPMRTAERVLQDFSAFSKHLPLIAALCNPMLRDRHWEALAKETGFAFKPAYGMTFASILEQYDFTPYIAAIQRIASQASHELEVEHGVAEIKSSFEQLMLHTIPYNLWLHVQDETAMQASLPHTARGWGTPTGEEEELTEHEDADRTTVISDIPEVLAKISDLVFRVKFLFHSTYASAFKEQLAAWTRKTGNISRLLEKLSHAQTMWTSIKPLYTAAEVRAKLPADARCFDQVAGEWEKQVGAVISQFPRLSSLLAELKEDKVDSYITRYDKLTRALSSFLEAERLACPWLFFLSDPELMDFLSTTANPGTLHQSPYIAMIPGATGLSRAQPDEIDLKTYEGIPMAHLYNGVRTVYGETVVITPPVFSAKGKCTDWISALSTAISDSLYSSAKPALRDYAKAFESGSDESVTQALYKWPQALIPVGIGFAVTTLIDSALESPSPKDGLIAIEARLLGLCTSLRPHLLATYRKVPESSDRRTSSLVRRMVVTLNYIVLYYVDVLRDLLEDSTHWRSHMRVYLNDQRPTICFGASCVDFGYQLAPPLVRPLATMLDALHETIHIPGIPVHALSGQLAMGKKTMYTDYGALTGHVIRRVPTVPFGQSRHDACTQHLMTTVLRYIRGAVAAGLWLVITVDQASPPTLLSVLAEVIRSVRDALAARASTVNLIGTNIPFRSTTKLFISGVIPQYHTDLRLTARPVQFHPPSPEVLDLVQLQSHGVRNAEAIGEIVAEWMGMFGRGIKGVARSAYLLQMLQYALRVLFEDDEDDEYRAFKAAFKHEWLSSVPARLYDSALSYMDRVFETEDQRPSPEAETALLRRCVRRAMDRQQIMQTTGLVNTVVDVMKSIRLVAQQNTARDITVSRGVVIAAPPLAGKSTVRRLAFEALSVLGRSVEDPFAEILVPTNAQVPFSVDEYVICPEAIGGGLMWGFYDSESGFRPGTLETLISSLSAEYLGRGDPGTAAKLRALLTHSYKQETALVGESIPQPQHPPTLSVTPSRMNLKRQEKANFIVLDGEIESFAGLINAIQPNFDIQFSNGTTVTIPSSTIIMIESTGMGQLPPAVFASYRVHMIEQSVIYAEAALRREFDARMAKIAADPFGIDDVTLLEVFDKKERGAVDLSKWSPNTRLARQLEAVLTSLLLGYDRIESVYRVTIGVHAARTIASVAAATLHRLFTEIRDRISASTQARGDIFMQLDARTSAHRDELPANQEGEALAVRIACGDLALIEATTAAIKSVVTMLDLSGIAPDRVAKLESWFREQACSALATGDGFLLDVPSSAKDPERPHSSIFSGAYGTFITMSSSDRVDTIRLAVSYEPSTIFHDDYLDMSSLTRPVVDPPQCAADLNAMDVIPMLQAIHVPVILGHVVGSGSKHLLAAVAAKCSETGSVTMLTLPNTSGAEQDLSPYEPASVYESDIAPGTLVQSMLGSFIDTKLMASGPRTFKPKDDKPFSTLVIAQLDAVNISTDAASCNRAVAYGMLSEIMDTKSAISSSSATNDARQFFDFFSTVVQMEIPSRRSTDIQVDPIRRRALARSVCVPCHYPSKRDMRARVQYIGAEIIKRMGIIDDPVLPRMVAAMRVGVALSAELYTVLHTAGEVVPGVASIFTHGRVTQLLAAFARIMLVEEANPAVIWVTLHEDVLSACYHGSTYKDIVQGLVSNSIGDEYGDLDRLSDPIAFRHVACQLDPAIDFEQHTLEETLDRLAKTDIPVLGFSSKTLVERLLPESVLTAGTPPVLPAVDTIMATIAPMVHPPTAFHNTLVTGDAIGLHATQFHPRLVTIVTNSHTGGHAMTLHAVGLLSHVEDAIGVVYDNRGLAHPLIHGKKLQDAVASAREAHDDLEETGHADGRAFALLHKALGRDDAAQPASRPTTRSLAPPDQSTSSSRPPSAVEAPRKIVETLETPTERWRQYLVGVVACAALGKTYAVIPACANPSLHSKMLRDVSWLIHGYLPDMSPMEKNAVRQLFSSETGDPYKTLRHRVCGNVTVIMHVDPAIFHTMALDFPNASRFIRRGLTVALPSLTTHSALTLLERCCVPHRPSGITTVALPAPSFSPHLPLIHGLRLPHRLLRVIVEVYQTAFASTTVSSVTLPSAIQQTGMVVAALYQQRLTTLQHDHTVLTMALDRLERAERSVRAILAEINRLEPLLEESKKQLLKMRMVAEADKAKRDELTAKATRLRESVSEKSAEIEALTTAVAQLISSSSEGVTKSFNRLVAAKRADIGALRAKQPTGSLMTILECICIIKGLTPRVIMENGRETGFDYWPEAKLMISDTKFVQSLEYIEGVPTQALREVGERLSDPAMQGRPKKPTVAADLGKWVNSFYKLKSAELEVKPKQARAEMLREEVENEKEELVSVEAELADVISSAEENLEKLDTVKHECDDVSKHITELTADHARTIAMVKAFFNERGLWAAIASTYSSMIQNAPGDSLRAGIWVCALAGMDDAARRAVLQQTFLLLSSHGVHFTQQANVSDILLGDSRLADVTTVSLHYPPVEIRRAQTAPLRTARSRSISSASMMVGTPRSRASAQQFKSATAYEPAPHVVDGENALLFVAGSPHHSPALRLLSVAGFSDPLLPKAWPKAVKRPAPELLSLESVSSVEGWPARVLRAPDFTHPLLFCRGTQIPQLVDAVRAMESTQGRQTTVVYAPTTVKGQSRSLVVRSLLDTVIKAAAVGSCLILTGVGTKDAVPTVTALMSELEWFVSASPEYKMALAQDEVPLETWERISERQEASMDADMSVFNTTTDFSQESASDSDESLLDSPRLAMEMELAETDVSATITDTHSSQREIDDLIAFHDLVSFLKSAHSIYIRFGATVTRVHRQFRLIFHTQSMEAARLNCSHLLGSHLSPLVLPDSFERTAAQMTNDMMRIVEPDRLGTLRSSREEVCRTGFEHHNQEILAAYSTAVGGLDTHDDTLTGLSEARTAHNKAVQHAQDALFAVAPTFEVTTRSLAVVYLVANVVGGELHWPMIGPNFEIACADLKTRSDALVSIPNNLRHFMRIFISNMLQSLAAVAPPGLVQACSLLLSACVAVIETLELPDDRVVIFEDIIKITAGDALPFIRGDPSPPSATQETWLSVDQHKEVQRLVSLHPRFSANNALLNSLETEQEAWQEWIGGLRSGWDIHHGPPRPFRLHQDISKSMLTAREASTTVELSAIDLLCLVRALVPGTLSVVSAMLSQAVFSATYNMQLVNTSLLLSSPLYQQDHLFRFLASSIENSPAIDHALVVEVTDPAAAIEPLSCSYSGTRLYLPQTNAELAATVTSAIERGLPVLSSVKPVHTDLLLTLLHSVSDARVSSGFHLLILQYPGDSNSGLESLPRVRVFPLLERPTFQERALNFMSRGYMTMKTQCAGRTEMVDAASEFVATCFAIASAVDAFSDEILRCLLMLANNRGPTAATDTVTVFGSMVCPDKTQAMLAVVKKTRAIDWGSDLRNLASQMRMAGLQHVDARNALARVSAHIPRAFPEEVGGVTGGAGTWDNIVCALRPKKELG
ncbi:Dynein heavy chain, N-terminal region 2 [Carpediemonas membranifera]|uniref:Dynein heavy chain, N-terminal region 2 n=1 Tax=Carpediemonas membranifera TaxID=201153 RepID=A0A8J6BAB9_9EUKA|nr:Dynein heavy chain, N-terminal region 2 [Carpediemonas membranifera]|eukprot:KAG9397429.1 Dynein heavy chain, N-terminal region 2 [Carpediemonas membranifera]